MIAGVEHRDVLVRVLCLVAVVVALPVEDLRPGVAVVVADANLAFAGYYSSWIVGRDHEQEVVGALPYQGADGPHPLSALDPCVAVVRRPEDFGGVVVVRRRAE